MRALGVSGDWMFFEHAGSAVAVDLDSGDVTDLFSIDDLAGHATWAAARNTAAERRAALVARSALATGVDSLQRFAIPDAVRSNAHQAQHWTAVYHRPIELPLIAAGPSLLPPSAVQKTAHSVIDADLDHADIARAEHLASGRPVKRRVVRQMQTYFDRHPKAQVDPAVWASWGGDAGRAWARKLARLTASAAADAAADDAQARTLGRLLAEDEDIDYDTLRLLPRAFAVLCGPHTAECDGNGACSCGGSKTSAQYPSSRALTYLALGGDEGREWAQRTIRRAEAEALLASGYDPDANVDVENEEVPAEESFDGTAPHMYTPIRSNPDLCRYCGTGEMDERHQPDAVDYSQADITPDDAHYFSQTVDDETKCEICGKAVDDTLHKQAALADYYANKSEIDKKVAETQEYWAGKGAEGEETPEEPVVTAAMVFGVDWDEVDASDPMVQAAAVDDDLEKVFWERRGTEDDDPLTYYVAYTGDDSLSVDQLYVSDGAMFYKYQPHSRSWEQARLETPSQVYELDDDTAREVVRALSVFPGQSVDLREVDPGETRLMQEVIPALDDEMLDRVVVVTAAASFATDDGYTPEERAANAKKQVRDAGGKFAKSGSKVRVGSDSRTGTVKKINPETQEVEVQYDDDGSTAWVPAKNTRVDETPAENPAPEEPPEEVPETIDVSKIAAKPRATGRTPKATTPSMLKPMDKDAINAVIENYPNFIEKERKGAAARQEAQKAQNEADREKYRAEEKKAEADYERRLEKIHAKGKGPRDWVDNVYRKILPKKYRRGTRQIHRQNASLLAAGTAILDPTQSDVAPIYMAEVDEANQNAVLELLAMVPATTEGTEPQILRYTGAGWISDPKILRQLRSSSPPAIVSLDEQTFTDTLEQVKHFYTTEAGKAEAEAEAKQAESLVAATMIWGEYGELLAAGIPGIADTPSDIANTEKLKRYWTIGEGGAKIRWNTPGDMTRCMRLLKKYMPKPGMSEGYCANLHHDMTGTWPGDKNNVGHRASGFPRVQLFDTRLLTSDEVIRFSALAAGAGALCAGVEAPESVLDVPTELTGAPFVIPILAPVGVKSGDGRSFAPLSLSTRNLPLPLMWQIQTAEGHDSSVIVGRIDSVDEAEDGSLVNARGVFDVGPYGQEAERLVRHKFLRGVSVDLDNFEAEARSPDALVEREKNEAGETEAVRIIADDMLVTNGRVMGATLVAKPAFQEVTIELDEGMEEETMVADGTYIGTPESEAETEELIRSALTAAGIPVRPPKDWFTDPGLKKETPLTVLDDGRVYGHVATWDTDHIGLPFSTRPPRSNSNYAYFHTGLLRTETGEDVTVGQITLAGGHAPLEANAAAAVKHYDDTASAFCDVHAGEDAYGIWVAGALRPSVTAEQVRAIRAAAPSGDWRPIHGRLEMVAVCQVNVPGFPVTHARVASGHVYALVAAGTQVLNRIRAESDSAPLDKLIERIDALEIPQREALNAAREAATARIEPIRQERQTRLEEAREAALSRFKEQRSPEATAVRQRVAALMSGGDELFRDIGEDKRKELAKKGAAMPDGQYPIATVGDLKNAIRAYGRAKDSDKPKVRRHIKKRARSLGKTDLIPESWASLSDPFSDLAGEINDIAARIALVSGATHVPVILHGDETVLDNAALLAVGHYPNGEPWDPGNHPRDEKGKFRQVIAELKQDLKGEIGTQQAVEGLDEAEAASARGDTQAAQQAAKEVLDLVDKMAGATEDEQLVNTLREGYGNLADAVANLPLAFGDLNEKYRFSDLPTDLKSLIEDLYKRAEKRLDNDAMQEAGGKLSEFMAGGDVLSQPQISAELSRLLRYLI